MVMRKNDLELLIKLLYRFENVIVAVAVAVAAAVVVVFEG